MEDRGVMKGKNRRYPRKMLQAIRTRRSRQKKHFSFMATVSR